MKYAKMLPLMVVFLTSCVAPATPEPTQTLGLTITPTATQTPTLVIPSQTPIPTEISPESLLPQEVQEIFDQAGINLKDMQNAKYDNDGLHITLEGEETVDVKTKDLEKFVYFENGVTKEILKFLPVRNTETKQTFSYTFDTTTKTWPLSKVLEPLKISTNNNNPSSRTFEDVISGHLAETLHEQEITFPKDAINMGWDYKSGEVGTAPIFLVNGSKNVMQLVNYCKIPADLLGLTGTIDIATVAVLNPDGTIGVLNFALGVGRNLSISARQIELSHAQKLCNS